jgi:hypothetical protein
MACGWPHTDKRSSRPPIYHVSLRLFAREGRMSLQIICPHCSSTLVVPENCGGQATRCPNCLQNFVIPVSLPTASFAPPSTQTVTVPPPIEQQQSEDQPTEADLREAQERFEHLTGENIGLQAELARRLRARRRVARNARWLDRFRGGRQGLDHSIGRRGGFFVLLALAPAVAIVVFSALELSAFGLLAVALIAMLLVGVAYVPFSFYPHDKSLALLIPQEQERLREAEKLYEQLAAAEAEQRARLEVAEREYQRIKAAVSSRLAWLRKAHWQQMHTKALTKFLQQVFEEHGYTVEPTGKKGQVGIDLVVVREGTRIAVQVKGAQVETVDQQVVQQTQAGQGMHRCQRSVLITNAQFMPSARQLAGKLGVRLIDAGEMPELIEGRISV